MKEDIGILEPMVSVVIISYDHEKYIEKCLENVINQITNFDFEIIISNDCSKDNTNTIIENFIAQHDTTNKIRYYNQEKNLGMLSNTAFVLKNAKGKYIAMCDGDDYWTDSLKLQKQVDFLEKNQNIVFCFHNASRFDEYDNKFYPYTGLNKFKDKQVIPKRKLFKHGGGTFPTSSAMFKSEIMKELPSYFFSFGVNDTPIFFKAITEGEIGYLNDDMVVYSSTQTNWSSQNNFFENKLVNYNTKIKAYKEFDNVTQHQYREYLKDTISHLTYQIIFAYCKEEKKIVNRFKFYLKYMSRINVKQNIKSIYRILN
jgi:glycosyltransferase involved in cell wall biosynthesis